MDKVWETVKARPQRNCCRASGKPWMIQNADQWFRFDGSNPARLARSLECFERNSRSRVTRPSNLDDAGTFGSGWAHSRGRGAEGFDAS